MRTIGYIAVLCGIAALNTIAVDLTNSDPFGTSSFIGDANGFWNPSGAPSPGNAYAVNAFTLRTPTGGAPYTFQGDSLTLQGGATLLYKGTNSQISVTGLNLNDGTVSTGQENSTMTLAGNIAVGPGSGTFFAGDTGSRVISVTAAISGNGPVISRGDNGGNDWVQFSNNNTYTGTTTVDNNYLVLTNSNALGGTVNGTTVINSGTLQLNGTGVMAPEPLILNGTGQNGYRGALGNWSGNNTWTGDITLATSSGIYVNNSSSLQISGDISGSGNLTKTTSGTAGGGTLFLTGTNTYTGSTTVNRGWLILGRTYLTGETTGSINGTSGVNLAGTSNGIAFRRSNTYNFTPDISHTGGTGRILQQGAGNLVFDGNTVAGSQVRSESGTVTVDNGASLTLSGFTEAMSTAGNRTVGLYIGKGNAGPYGFNLTNGTVTVNNSDVMLGESGGLTTSNISPGGNLNINNGRYEVGFNGAIDVNQTGGAVTVTNSHVVLGRYANADVEYNMSGGTMITQGGGNQRMHMAWNHANSRADLNLSGTAVVTTNADGGNASGGFFIANNGTGTVRVADTASLTINGQGDSAGGLQLGYSAPGRGTLIQTGGTVTVNNNYIMAGRFGTGTVTVDGGTFTQQGTGNQNTYLGWNGGASTGNLNVGGTGVVTLGNNLYAGGNGDGVITVSDTGSLTVPGATVLGWNPGSTGTLNLDGGTFTTNSIAINGGTGSVTADGGTYRAGDSHSVGMPIALGNDGITVDSNTHNLSLNGPISGAGGLTKTGIGTAYLTGANSYAGTTSILEGTLSLAPPTPVTGAALWLDATNAATITNGPGGVQQWENAANPGTGDLVQVNSTKRPELVPNAINGLPAVRFTAASNDRLNNTINYGTPMSIFGIGQLTGGANRRLISSTAGNWLLGWWNNEDNSAFFEGWVNNAPGGTADTNVHLYGATIPGPGNNSSIYANGGLIAANQNGVAGLNGLALGGWQTGSSESSNGQVGEVLVYQSALSSAQRTAVEAYLAGKWMGSATDSVPDTSHVSIGAAGTFDLADHTETIGGLSGAAGSSVLLGSGTLTTGGNHTDNTFAGVISGSGNMVKTGSGTLTYGGANTYTGTTTISNGTLEIGDGTTNGSLDGAVGSLTVGAGATLAFDRTDTVTFSRQIIGAPTSLIEHNGSGTTTLDNVTNTFSGRYNVNAGALAIASAPAMGTPNRIHIQSGAHFDASAIPIFKPNTTISGNGEIIVSALPGQGLDVSGSTMSPGNSPGTLTVTGNLLVSAPVYTYDWELLDSTSFAGLGGGWDLIDVTGTADFAGIAALGDAVLNLSGIAANPSGIDPNIHEFEGKVTNLTILTAAGGISNFDHNFWTINAGNLGSVADITLAFSDANNLILTFTSTVPEPSTYALMALILVAFGFYARRQTPKSA